MAEDQAQQSPFFHDPAQLNDDPRVAILLIRRDVEEIKQDQKRQSTVLFGRDGEPGLHTRVDRIEQWLISRKRLEGYFLGALITTALGSVGSLFFLIWQYLIASGS